MKLFKYLSFCLTLCLLGLSSMTHAQKESIQWKSFEEVESLMASNPKRIMVNLYTDWCGWCKRLEKNTFSNPQLAKYINDNFYAIRFNAESKEAVQYKGRTFQFKPEIRMHELAAEIMMGGRGFPFTAIIEMDGQNVSPIPGYQTVKEMEYILTYIHEGRLTNLSWDEWQKQYKPKW